MYYLRVFPSVLPGHSYSSDRTMTSLPEVRDLEAIVGPHLNPNESIVDVQRSRLTAPGENYGSIMLRILIKIRDKATGKERVLDAVGKVIPDSAAVREVFDTQVTFRIEYEYYTTVVPAMDRFLKERGFPEGADYAAPFLGGRLNLDGSSTVDENAIILMDNLQSLGYTTGTKTKGLDLDTSKLVLKTLAKYHASTIGLRLLSPQIFEEKIKPSFYGYIPQKDLLQMTLGNIIHHLEKAGFTKQQLDRVKEIFGNDARKTNVSDVWGTLTHYDTWTKNILVKHESAKPVDAILVDFQVPDYGTPLNDVMMFLFTSVEQDLLEQNMDSLLDFYYDAIIGYLKKVGLDTKPFTKASFNDEIKIAVSKYEYVHALWMSIPIMHEAVKSVEDFDTETKSFMQFSDAHVRKIAFITKLGFERGWF